MPESKHFFEGYSRSKDTLMTIADKITSATIERPWTLKSSGYIASTDASFNTRPHICLRREMKNGDVVNVLFVDHNNTATNNIFGNISVYCYWYDGCDITNDKFMYQSPFTFSLQYHTSLVADSDGSPQFSWHWIWVDNEGIAMTVFGNVGTAGTATAGYGMGYIGTALPYHKNFKETFCFYGTHATNFPSGIIWDSSMQDFVVPHNAPYNWMGLANRVMPLIFTQNNQYSNPSPLLSNTFIASRPALAQSTDTDRSGSWGGAGQTYELVQTHWFGNGQFLFCQPGATLYRGDIVAIESEKCDFIFQTTGTEVSRNILIKRMESVTNLVGTGAANNVSLEWKNPEKCYGVKIVRKLDILPTNYNDGVEIFNKTLDSGLLAGQAQAITDTSASAGHYFYRAFAYSSNNVVSVPVQSAACEITL